MSPTVKRRIASVLVAGAIKWTLWALLGWCLDDLVGLSHVCAWGWATGVGTVVGLYMLWKLWNYEPGSRRGARGPATVRVVVINVAAFLSPDAASEAMGDRNEEARETEVVTQPANPGKDHG